MNTWLRDLSCAGLLLLFSVACGNEPVPKSRAPAQWRFLLTATPEKVSVGGSTVISWKTKNAVELTLSGNDVAIPVNPGAMSDGSVSVIVDEATFFKPVAKGTNGAEVDRSVSVAIDDPPTEKPEVLSFVAEPADVEEGETSTLSWSTKGAESVRIVASTGASIDVAGQPASSGSVEVTVGGSTVFTLTAEKDGETATRNATVTVKGFPVATLAIAPGRVDFGEPAVLSWTTSNAVSVVITDSFGGTLVDTTEELMGQRTLHPEATTTYELKAVGAGGKETLASAKVEVAAGGSTSRR